MDFQYKVTVIVPVYNVEEYLRSCLDSLVAQTIDHSQMEVLLINDGSTDNSLDICYEYAQSYFMFKVFSKENEGPAAARNCGIKNVHGKYIMYLDSDDELTPETVKAVTDFFDTVYDEVDIVTYYDRHYKDGKELKAHFRYKYLTKTGIYDLVKFPYITQSRLNICVKNLLNDNYLFGEMMHLIHEDQEYINHIVTQKMKIGYCSNGEYHYLKNDTSIMSTYATVHYMFEDTMKYYEHLFSQYEHVPAYLQGMFIHDLSWKLWDNSLFPYHYEKKQFDIAMGRIGALMDRIDIDTVMNHPNIDKFHKYFFLSFRKEPILPIIGIDSCQLYCQGKKIHSEKSIEVIVRRIKVLNGSNGKMLRIYGSIKSPVFSFIEKPRFYAYINNKIYDELELSISGSSWYKTRTQTNTFWAFIFEYDISKISTLNFKVEMDGIYLDTRFWFDRLSPFKSDLKLQEYVLDNYIIKFFNNTFSFSYADENVKQMVLKNNRSHYSEEINKKRDFYLSASDHQHEIWLYYDNYTVDYDNGYFQFIHDFNKQDGVERYYIYSKEFNEIQYLFEEKHLNNIIKFGSERHRMLYLNSSKIFTAFIEHFSITPFTSGEETNYIDLFNAEIIYLQHGVMHAYIPWYYRPEMVENDKIVISSYFEKSNLVENCGYKKEDLIPAGMPRYDHINKNSVPKNRIIFAPSWRDYLIGKYTDSGARRETFDNKMLESNYYKNIMLFLSSERLQKKLEEKDIYLDLKLHPDFYSTYRHLLNFNYDRIKLVEANNKVNLENYKMFITDFSSFSFDYAYLSRPIMYFIPDYIEFKSGMNRYRDLYIPFDKAFGNLTTTPEAAVDEVIRIINNDFVPDPEFKERMDKFYLPLENCAETLYQYMQNKPEGECVNG